MANELEETSARDERQERMQRVRVGLTGLAVVLVLVFIATAVIRQISDSAMPAPGGSVTNNVAGVEPDEPLADLGVAPGASNAAADPAAP